MRPSDVKAAYRGATRFQSQREREADIFRQAVATLQGAPEPESAARARAISDNRQLWGIVNTLMRDPGNGLPVDLRASILSVGMAVQREMDRGDPDIGFLIAVNDSMAVALEAGQTVN
jgi:flagellar protein FlaF